MACEPWCVSPCSELNGNNVNECGGCTGAAFRCQPGVDGFAVRAAVNAAAAVSLAQAEPSTPLFDLMEPLREPSRLDLLWATPVYSADLSPRMAPLNDALAGVVADRWAALAARLPSDIDPGSANEIFHDEHRHQLAAPLRRFRQCGLEHASTSDVADAESAARACEAQVAAESVWPELLNNSGFRTLFAGGSGLVWEHVRRYGRALGLSRAGASRDGASPDGAAVRGWSTWATYQQRGLHHAEHGHAGSQLSGVYYVRSPGEDETSAGGGLLRVFDPRHEAVRAMFDPSDAALAPRASRSFEPRPGLLLLWPSYLRHEVTPTRGESARVSFPFDLHIETGPAIARSAGGVLETHAALAMPLDGCGGAPAEDNVEGEASATAAAAEQRPRASRATLQARWPP